MTGCGQGAASEAADTAGSAATGEAADAAAPSGEAGKTTLNVLWWGSQTRHEQTTAMLEKFEELNPDIDVVMDYSDWDGYWTKLPAQVAGGQTPTCSRWTTRILCSTPRTACWPSWTAMWRTAASI